MGRVIARPYIGKKKGEFVRMSNRHDYALKPSGATVLNALKDAGYDVIGVGKINDIFSGEGIKKTYRSQSSIHGILLAFALPIWWILMRFGDIEGARRVMGRKSKSLTGIWESY